MCKNHALRHVPAEVVAFVEKTIRATDRGSEENAQKLLEANVALVCWVGMLQYVLDIVQDRDPELAVEGERLYRSRVAQIGREMTKWLDEHPEANAKAVTIRSTVVSTREVD